jgi:exoribonuclease R
MSNHIKYKINMFTVHIKDRDYTEWHLINESTALNVSPLANKLFHGDILDSSGQLIASPYKEKTDICGVLLTSEKTYGRDPSGNKLLYKCVPDDEHLPCFLIPYEEKQMGFQKTKEDKYITFRIKEWLTTKHPFGLVTNTFGPVNDKDAYVAYRMACKELNASLKNLNAMSLRRLRENALAPIPLYCAGHAIEDRRKASILSIDPVGCNDIDDAIGLRTTAEGETVLSIYIANVPMMLEYLQLWPYLTERIATIYLPMHKFPMLPPALSENMCSLKEKEDRVAFALDINLSTMAIQYTSTIIRVEKNYAYDAAELLGRADYKQMLDIVKYLNARAHYVDKITNSHELVEYCMLFMNMECAKALETKKSGIFRSATKKETEDYVECPAELKRVLQGAAGEYCSFADRKPHELIGKGLKTYVHVTSPIRRIVDIVNMTVLLKEQVAWSADATDFLEKLQTKMIPMINAKTKAIRKLQNDMELLQTYEKEPNRTYTGIVFNRTEINAKGQYNYNVYIAETKMLTTVRSTSEITNFTTKHFSAHLFLDEAKMTKKIRLQPL